jgi:O-antigen/teichoic acid export membrane protein
MRLIVLVLGLRFPVGGRRPYYAAMMTVESARVATRDSAAEAASIVRGMSVALVGSVVGGGLGFLFLVVMARLLDVREFGLLVLAVNVLGTAVAVSVAGTDYTMIRNVAAAESPGRKRGAMIAPLQLALGVNLAVALAAAAFAEPLAADVLGEPGFAGVLRVLALALPFTVLAQMFSAALSGLEYARGELARKVVEQAGRIVLASLAVVVGLGVRGAVLGMALAAAVAAATVGYLLLRSLPRGGTTERISVRRVIGYSWPQAVANLATQSWVLMSMIILVHATDAQDVALFGAALALAQLPLLIYNAFSYRFSPVISRLWGRGDVDALSETLKSVTRWVAMLAIPLYAVAIALPGSLLRVYGPRYDEAAGALAIMTVATLVNALAGPVERALIMTGRARLEMATNVAATLVTLGVALVLTPLYGLTGAAVSTLVYAVLRNAAKSYFVRRTMGTTALSLALLGPVAAAVVAAAPVAVVGNVTGLGSSLVGTTLLGVAVIGLYAFVLIRLIGIPQADRRILTLAVRPGA